MSYELEFFRRTTTEPAGKAIRRLTGDFADLKEAEQYGLTNAGDADGFRIYVNGANKKTVSIRPGKPDA